MYLFSEYESVIDREYDTAVLEKNISVKRAFSDFYKESAIIAFESEYGSDTTQGSSAGRNLITKIVEAIKRLIDVTITTLSNIFSRKERMTAEEYFGSTTVQIQLSQDINKLEQIVDNEMLKGRRIIQAISTTTGVSDQTVANFVDGIAKSLKTVGPVALSATAAWAIKSQVFNKLSKRKKDLDALKVETEANMKPGEYKKSAKVWEGIDKLFTAYTGLSKEFGRAMKANRRKSK